MRRGTRERQGYLPFISSWVVLFDITLRVEEAVTAGILSVSDRRDNDDSSSGSGSSKEEGEEEHQEEEEEEQQ